VTPHVVWQRLRLGDTALEDQGALDFPFCGDNPDPCLHFIEFLAAEHLTREFGESGRLLRRPLPLHDA